MFAAQNGGGLFEQGSFFKVDENSTPEMLDKKRKLMAMLSPQYGRAKYVGEGLGQLATGIASGMKRRQMDKFEGEKRSGATDMFNRVMGGGQTTAAPEGGFSILGQAPLQAPAPVSENQGIANDAMAAVGREPFVAPEGIPAKIHETAVALGVDPVDLATAISYETAGTFDPTKQGPTTQWGQHRGLIQFGEPQAQKYGVNWDDPVGSQLGADGAVANYLRDTGVKPGMGLLDIYSAINAGGVGRYNRSDANNGGAPGSVRDKVENQMAGHRAKAMAMFGGDFVPQQSGPPNNELSAALNNPWLSPAQKEQIQGIISKREQQADPLYQMQVQGAQMGLEKDRMELEQMRNPGAAKMQVVELADGYKYYVDPTGQTQPRRVNENVQAQPNTPLVDMSGANFGQQPDTRPMADKPEKGFQRRYDPENKTWVDEPIPGGSKDTTEVDERKDQNDRTSTSIISTAAGRAREAARSRTVGGLLGSVASKNPRSQNAEVYRQVEVLTANAKVSNLQAMREASKTGGALGAVSDKESAMLQAKSGALDPASPNFERDLDDYERTLLQVVHGFDDGNAIFETQRIESINAMDMGALLEFRLDDASDAETKAWMRRMDEVDSQ